MKLLKWDIDQNTKEAAKDYPLPDLPRQWAEQPPGRNLHLTNWENRVSNPPRFREPIIACNPVNIIDEFEREHYLEGLAMVAVWGNMRKLDKIYAKRLCDIENALAFCVKSMEENSCSSIYDSWEMLTGQGQAQLGWTAVMASKTLHFLSRAAGFEKNPLVAIDNQVFLDCVWPCWRACWRNKIPQQDQPGDWAGKPNNPKDGFEAYQRYMSAIITWAKPLGWTTTQMEATIFDHYRA